MFKKYILSLALIGSIHHTQAHDDAWSTLKTTCVVAGTVGAAALSYKAYAHWLIKRAQAHFARERDLLNRYAQYSAYTQSWTTDDGAVLLRDLKAIIVHQHNINRDRLAISIMYDIYYAQPAMYVSYGYYNFPLLQHVADLDWYIGHLKIIRLLSLHPDEYEVSSLIEQLTYIRHMIMSDHNYTQEAALYRIGIRDHIS